MSAVYSKEGFSLKRLMLAGIALTLAARAQIKLGVAGPITGPNAAFGEQLKYGAKQAVEDINAKSGVLGQKIDLSSATTFRIPQGVAAANKFADEGVKFVVGHFNSGVTIPATEIYAQSSIVDDTPPATTEEVTIDGSGTCSAPAAVTTSRASRRQVSPGRVQGQEGRHRLWAGPRWKYATSTELQQGGRKEVLWEGVNTSEKDYVGAVGQGEGSRRGCVLLGRSFTPKAA